MLDSSSPWGYESRHAALHGAGSYDEAIEALNEMLLKLEQSSDPHARGKYLLYNVGRYILSFVPDRAPQPLREPIPYDGRDSQLCQANPT